LFVWRNGFSSKNDSCGTAWLILFLLPESGVHMAPAMRADVRLALGLVLLCARLDSILCGYKTIFLVHKQNFQSRNDDEYRNESRLCDSRDEMSVAALVVWRGDRRHPKMLRSITVLPDFVCNSPCLVGEFQAMQIVAVN
jgi:hypothetical protein